jgi:hypothetical protein
MLKISLKNKTICFVPTIGLDFWQLGVIREMVAEKEGVNIYALTITHEKEG